ncbi:hypothetical protein BP5796_10476 [Coleophoma crateriformis]|uniref:Uncharacterized protein n=1 Tax=Coleophoma crateriformis TaxID=565419 RepID=A0A3D8QR52_9HELO|nr:hypothetical protein BP5796_10476 [Coleophoma crateriformis]
MPYSDNLYSADDDLSDNESLSDQLSPSDGYFSRPDSLPNVMVPDPSLEQGHTAEAKAREAREEAHSNLEGQEQLNSSGTNSPAISRSTPSRLDTSVPSVHASTPSPTLPISPSPISPRRYYNPYPSSRTPLLQGPPPAYTPASPSTSPLSPQAPTSPQAAPEPAQNYNTFAYHRLEDGLPSSQGPQSMGSPPNPPNEESPLWRRQQKQYRGRGVIQRLLFISLIVSIVLALLMTIVRSGNSAHVPSRRPIEDTPGKPVTDIPTPQRPHTPEAPNPSQPDTPEVPKTPKNPKEPVELLPPPDTGAANHKYCQYAKIGSEVGVLAWRMKKHLHIRQTTFDNTGIDMTPISTYGEVRLRRIPKDSPYYDTDGYMEFFIYTSDPDIQTGMQYNNDERLIKIETPRQARLQTPGPHCISVELTAWIPEGAEFDEIIVETVELTQSVFDGIDINVSKSARFKSITGGIHFPKIDTSGPMWSTHQPKQHSQGMEDGVGELDELGTISSSNFSSRHIEISTTTGSITGLYPLYDYLGIDSMSGSVSVSIAPKPVDPKAPLPATLEISTRSGSINAKAPVNGPAWVLPPRRYDTKVTSMSGSIGGSYIAGSSGDWHSNSGSLHLEVLPMIENGKAELKSIFNTATLSGSNRVELLEPIFIPSYKSYEETKPGKPYKPIGEDDPYLLLPDPDMTEFTADPKLHTLVSTHSSKSGTVEVKYPDSWEGIVDLKALSGSINTSGNIEIIKDGKKDWVHREVVAQHPKGGRDLDRASTVLVENLSEPVEPSRLKSDKRPNDGLCTKARRASQSSILNPRPPLANPGKTLPRPRKINPSSPHSISSPDYSLDLTARRANEKRAVPNFSQIPISCDRPKPPFTAAAPFEERISSKSHEAEAKMASLQKATASALKSSSTIASAQSSSSARRQLNAVVVSAGLMQKTVKVRIGVQKWNSHVRKNYNLASHLLVHDPNSSLRQGDVISITPGWRVSKHVHHVVDSIIAPYGVPIEERPRVPSEAERIAEREEKMRAKVERRKEAASRAEEGASEIETVAQVKATKVSRKVKKEKAMKKLAPESTPREEEPPKKTGWFS